MGDDFDFPSYNKELGWSDLSEGLVPKQELGLEGSPRLLAIVHYQGQPLTLSPPGVAGKHHCLQRGETETWSGFGISLRSQSRAGGRKPDFLSCTQLMPAAGHISKYSA